MEAARRSVRTLIVTSPSPTTGGQSGLGRCAYPHRTFCTTWEPALPRGQCTHLNGVGPSRLNPSALPIGPDTKSGPFIFGHPVRWASCSTEREMVMLWLDQRGRQRATCVGFASPHAPFTSNVTRPRQMCRPLITQNGFTEGLTGSPHTWRGRLWDSSKVSADGTSRRFGANRHQ